MEKNKSIKNDEKNIGECITFSVRSDENIIDTSGIDINSLEGYNQGVNFNELNEGTLLCNSIGVLNRQCLISNNLDLKYGYIRGTKTEEGKNKGLKVLDKFYSQAYGELDRESFMYNIDGVYGMLWIGSLISNREFAKNIISVFQEEVKSQGMPAVGFLEYTNGNPNESFGIMVTIDSNRWSDIQRAGKLWSMGKGFDKEDSFNIKKGKKVCYLEKNKTIRNDEKNIGKCITFAVREDVSIIDASGIDITSLEAYNLGVDFSMMNEGDLLCNSIGSK